MYNEENHKQAKPSISAERAFFIKLGEKGGWEQDCLTDGVLRLGYGNQPHAACINGDWDSVRQSFNEASDPGSITRHLSQVRQFYEQPASTLWVTFVLDRLHWCFSTPAVTQLPDRSKTRPVIGQWRDTDLNGEKLIKGKLSGKLLAVQGFQGTICAIKEINYLLHKINGTSEPHVREAEDALENLAKALVPIIKNLHPKDLETLTDLIFRQGGWQRTGVAGETEKDIDLDLISPITNERVAIQVKSKVTKATLDEYRKIFESMADEKKFYFVTHTPLVSIDEELWDGKRFVFWGPVELSRQAAKNGLAGWLIDKAS